MTAKEYLGQARRLQDLIRSHMEELDFLRTFAVNISYSLSGDKVQSGKQQDKIGETVAKIIDMEDKIQEEISRFLDLQAEIRTVIKALPNQEAVLILRLRYLEFLDWEEIAERLCYSLRQIHRKHNEALEEIRIPEG